MDWLNVSKQTHSCVTGATTSEMRYCTRVVSVAALCCSGINNQEDRVSSISTYRTHAREIKTHSLSTSMSSTCVGTHLYVTACTVFAKLTYADPSSGVSAWGSTPVSLGRTASTTRLTICNGFLEAGTLQEHVNAREWARAVRILYVLYDPEACRMPRCACLSVTLSMT